MHVSGFITAHITHEISFIVFLTTPCPNYSLLIFHQGTIPETIGICETKEGRINYRAGKMHFSSESLIENDVVALADIHILYLASPEAGSPSYLIIITPSKLHSANTPRGGLVTSISLLRTSPVLGTISSNLR